MNLELIDWQTAISLLIVTAAIWVLIRKTWLAFSGRAAGGCGTSCSNCPSKQTSASQAPASQKLVQLRASKR
jgi:hypothetical protein